MPAAQAVDGGFIHILLLVPLCRSSVPAPKESRRRQPTLNKRDGRRVFDTASARAARCTRHPTCIGVRVRARGQGAHARALSNLPHPQTAELCRGKARLAVPSVPFAAGGVLSRPRHRPLRCHLEHARDADTRPSLGSGGVGLRPTRTLVPRLRRCGAPTDTDTRGSGGVGLRPTRTLVAPQGERGLRQGTG